MALTYRRLSGSLAAIAIADTVSIADVPITFTLVDKNHRPCDVFAAATGELVAGKYTVRTEANGTFSIDLWPTDEADRECYYLCRINAFGFEDIIAPFPKDTYTPMDFAEWAALAGDPGVPAGTVYISYATNNIRTTVPAGNTNPVDAVLTSLFKGVDWTISMTDATAGQTTICKVLAVYDEGSARFTEYAVVGDLTNYAITVTIDGTEMTLRVQNLTPNTMDVIILRVPLMDNNG